jgi:phosphoribosylaminoimidazole-succinocarboxamide synthase
MRKNQKFPEPLLTPSTKEEEGHDRPISTAQIVSEGIVERDLWQQIEKTAQALFARGTQILAERGMILVDTKYELGLVDGDLVLIDEVHTPDSSRFWYAASYEERYSRGEEQRQLDKEHFRRWLMEQDYMGDGPPPEITKEIRLETGLRYVEAFETITGQTFKPESGSAEDEIQGIKNHVAAL